MGRLEDSILLIVDCSRISGRTREDLFMNSRDRMEQGGFLSLIEQELESIIKTHPLLRELRERRRREDIDSRLEDAKPLKDVLESILNKSPSFAAFLGGVGSLSNPFRSANKTSAEVFKGKQYPTVFKFRDRAYGEELHRDTAFNMRSRISFETDVQNDYFGREKFGGRQTLISLDDHHSNGAIPDYMLNLHNGIATLNLSLPMNASVGDTYRYELAIEDDTRNCSELR